MVGNRQPDDPGPYHDLFPTGEPEPLARRSLAPVVFKCLFLAALVIGAAMLFATH